ncbi:chemerin-like receptor 1 [Gastrophryne carolinensis]
MNDSSELLYYYEEYENENNYSYLDYDRTIIPVNVPATEAPFIFNNYIFGGVIKPPQFPQVIAEVLTISCFVISCIVGLIGNGLVIWIAGFKMKTVGAVWFTNLAIVDFIFCISLPVRLAEWVNFFRRAFNIETINDITLYFNCIISVLFLTIISLDRCVTIMWPFWARIHRTRRAATICSAFVWIVSSAIALIYVFILGIDIHTFYHYHPVHEYVQFSRTQSKGLKYLKLFRSFFMFGVCFTIILVCYGLIICKLRSNTMNRSSKFSRTFRIIIAVVISFFVCWFPFNVWPFLAKQDKIEQVCVDFLVSSLCLSLVCLSSCINPVLYVLIGKRGRHNSITTGIENTINDLK